MQHPNKRHRSWEGSIRESLGDERDCYNAVLNGHVNYGHQSWLLATHVILSKEEPVDESAEHALETLATIESLSRQLLNVKRRLWPAAERCARASGGSSSAQTEFTQARRRCNPLEPLGEGRKGGLNVIFMNRSAIKLANLDAILDFSLTTISSSAPFLFVDLCGSPGGFSEYIMRRCQSTGVTKVCRGYGMSLVGPNEHGHGTPWKLPPLIHDFKNRCETNYRICHGADGSGDIYCWENVVALQQHILNDLQECGLPHSEAKVHLVVADGGFDAQRDSECQEQLAQKIVVCQVSAALSLLLPGGTLVVKMFGFQTSVVRNLMRSLSELFKQLVVMKPISSRPASSERYVACCGFHGVNRDWSGLRWRDRMFLGDWQAKPIEHSIVDKNLDEFDRDLLSLNLKACFAILSCLERKSAALSAGNRADQPWQADYPKVNVDMYKRAWRLN